MNSRIRRGSLTFRAREERLEERLVMSGSPIPAEIRALLNQAPAGTPVRPNTPVLPFESAFATASFVDPTDHFVAPKQVALGQKDFVGPFVSFDATHGFIKIGSSSTIQDHATLVANPGQASGLTGIFIGGSVAVGDGATIIGPSAIGTTGGAATSIGANAVIDGAIIEAGAIVGALARVGPGVIVPTGYRVLPGANVTTDAEADTPSLGDVVATTSADTTTAAKTISNNVALASGYSMLFHGQSGTGGAATAGPVPSAVGASGSTIFFGALNTVEGASSEPGSARVNFEPASGTPQFISAAGKFSALLPNASYRFPARFTGAVTVNQNAGTVASRLGKHDSIRADEGQPITIGSIGSIGSNVSIHSPNGGVSTATTTTVTTTTTDTVTNTTTTAVTATTATTPGPATATAGTTTTTTTGTNTAGHATTGTVTTTIATKTTNVDPVTIGQNFSALTGAVILGGPTSATTIGDNVTVGAGAVVVSSTLGTGVFVGNRAYVANSTIAAGTLIPDGTIIINNQTIGHVQS